MRDVIQLGEAEQTHSLVKAVSRSLSPATHSQTSRQEQQPARVEPGNVFSMRTGTTSKSSNQSSRKLEVARKRAEIAAAKEARLRAELDLLEAESIEGSRITDQSRDELADRLNLIGAIVSASINCKGT